MAGERFHFWMPRWKRLLFSLAGAPPGSNYAEIEGAWLRLRLGVWLRADIPLAEIERVKHLGEQPVYSRLIFGFAAQRKRLADVRFKRRLPVRIILWDWPYEGVLLSLDDPEAFERRFAGLGDARAR